MQAMTVSLSPPPFFLIKHCLHREKFDLNLVADDGGNAGVLEETLQQIIFT
jgi:hypothetical protein